MMQKMQKTVDEIDTPAQSPAFDGSFLKI